MIFDHYTDLCELYALGALDADERSEFERHLAEGCDACHEGLNQARVLNETVLAATPRVQPSAALRSRVLAAIGEAPTKRRGVPVFWWASGLAAAVLILGFGIAWSNERQARLTNEAELTRLREIQQILQAPETKQVLFGPQPSAPHGSIFVHHKLGMILIAEDLPAPPAGWTYESWVVPKEGAPQPIEAFRATGGRGLSVLQSPLRVDQLKAVAVSLEPAGTPVTKPTKLVFAAPLG